MDNKSIFAENLKRQMELNNKSRREVSHALGVSYYTFSDWVNGKKYPRMDKVELLAKYFGVAKSDLIEEKPTTSEDDGLLDGLTEIDMDIIKKLPLLSPEQKKEYSSYLSYLLSKQEP